VSPQCCAITLSDSRKQVKSIYVSRIATSDKKVSIVVDRVVLGLATQSQGKSCHNSNIQITFAVIFKWDSKENTFEYTPLNFSVDDTPELSMSLDYGLERKFNHIL
jgi:hypothetical protein